MNYCLNSKELESLLLYLIKNKEIENKTLVSIVNNASQWQDKLICLTFSFARILERQQGLTLLNKKMIQKLFSMPDEMYIEIHECGEDFINYMLQKEHNNENNLELSLMTVQRKLSEYCYGKNTLRN